MIARQLRQHAPFTALGAISGVIVMLALLHGNVSRDVSESLFWSLHPLHVLLSALATAAMYRLHSTGRFLQTILVGLFGSIFIATLSDSIIPFVGEWMLDMPNRGLHLGIIEKWWLVIPLALVGSVVAWIWPRTRFPHMGHVLLSTWASLFHISMAVGDSLDALAMITVVVFLFLAVWIPCCASDIALPLLLAGDSAKSDAKDVNREIEAES